ncbi:MAG: tetrahydrofolate synthase [Flavobacteriaceae bacterium]|nr:tetrahydrofolate synthase [Flavobacteriaceae bacterium]
MTVGLAFHYFRKEKVDIAIVEVGMGGRLDSTNIISPEVSVITNIGLDHTQFLGNSLAAIAREKAGIIKSGIPVVVGETTEETIGVFREVAKWQNAPLYLCEEQPFPEYASDLKGNYQKPNLRTVVATLRLLQDKNWKISEASITAGLSRTVANTGLLGRWQQLGEQPTIICDTAHNREGLQWVMQQLREQTYKQLHIVLGVVHDKDLTAILPLFPKKAAYYFCRPDVPRGLEAEDLAAEARKVGLEGTVYESVTVAYQSALNVAEADDFIFIGGSTFTVAEVV